MKWNGIYKTDYNYASKNLWLLTCHFLSLLCHNLCVFRFDFGFATFVSLVRLGICCIETLYTHCCQAIVETVTPFFLSNSLHHTQSQHLLFSRSCLRTHTQHRAVKLFCFFFFFSFRLLYYLVCWICLCSGSWDNNFAKSSLIISRFENRNWIPGPFIYRSQSHFVIKRLWSKHMCYVFVYRLFFFTSRFDADFQSTKLLKGKLFIKWNKKECWLIVSFL